MKDKAVNSEKRDKRKGKRAVAVDADDGEEEEEEQDEYEGDEFIVDDIKEEEIQESDEEMHNIKRRKNKKKRLLGKNFVLDEDDYELLEENNTIGFCPPKPRNGEFKRLKIGRDNESEDQQKAIGRHSQGGRSAEEKFKISLFGDDEDFAEEDDQSEDKNVIGDEDEMADFIVDEDVDDAGALVRKSTKEKSHLMLCVASSTSQEALEIFGDLDTSMKKRLDDEFEPFVLSENRMTQKDDIIRERDIPERIQLSEDTTGPPPIDDQNVEEERNWIYDQLTAGRFSPLVGYDQVLKDINKDNIENVLRMMHVQKFDIPFISMYRKEVCDSLLKDLDDSMQEGDEMKIMKWHKILWTVQLLDRKWLLLQKRKSALRSYYQKHFEEENQRVDEETKLNLNKRLFESVVLALNDAKSEREVDDIDAKFNLCFPHEDDTYDGQFKRPKRKSLYTVSYNARLWQITNKFGASSETFGSLLSLEKISDDVEDDIESPEEVAAKFTCSAFKTPKDVLNGARHMAAVEISCEPDVKKYVRNIFMEKAVVSTSPTPEGNLAIDAYHQLGSVKWLHNKPLIEFVDAQWLLVQKGEEDKLLHVSIKLPEDVRMKLLSDASNCYLSKGLSKSAQLWNEQRRMILKDSFLTHILSSMEKETRSLLTAKAKNWLLVEYGKQLWNKVLVGSFKRKHTDSDLENESEVRVMACCWGPGKPATTFVMLDSAGELVDVLYAGSISVRSQAVTDQQRKRNDCQRLLKFIVNHQPHVICIGATNMACRQLREDINEIIEDHPKELGQELENITAIFGDETFPRLYENSKLASEQLPGQSGIVKRAVALGRYLQNPLAMVATLCGQEKEILSWKFHPLEHFLTPNEKYEIVEQIMVDASNQVGVDINLAASHEWLFAPLQFIAGLGPRKASVLQKAFMRAGFILNRKEIPMGTILKKKVFINAVGFLRVRQSGVASYSNHDMDLLDDTRIHPESYELAKNFAKDIYGDDALNESNDMDDMLEKVIEHVRSNPHELEVFDIDDYAKRIFDQYGTNKRETLYDIKMELLQGFRDYRAPFKEPSCEEEFAMLSGETDDTIPEGRIVQVTVRHIQESQVICVFDSGLKGMVSSDDFSDEGYDYEKVHVGDILTCKIKHVNKNRHVVYLTSKASDLQKGPYIDKRDPYYHEDRISMGSEMEKIRKNKENANKPLRPRMIVHPRFQNLTADEAIEYLSHKEPGESIMRPSSKGPLFLTLTLKVFDGVFAHKEIAEKGKDHKDMTSLLRLGKTLIIDKESFEDLNEVMRRYVDPLVTHLKSMLGFRKFRKGNQIEVDDLLKAEKAANPMRIVYCFGVSHEHPGTFILSYIRSANPHHEYVGVYPKGFRFRKKDFDSIDHLIGYFQKNIDKPLLGEGPSENPTWASSGGRESTDGRFNSRNTGNQNGHDSGIPRPERGRGRGHGRGRGRGRGRGNDFGTDGSDNSGYEEMKSYTAGSGWGGDTNEGTGGGGSWGSVEGNVSGQGGWVSAGDKGNNSTDGVWVRNSSSGSSAGGRGNLGTGGGSSTGNWGNLGTGGDESAGTGSHRGSGNDSWGATDDVGGQGEMRTSGDVGTGGTDAVWAGNRGGDGFRSGWGNQETGGGVRNNSGDGHGENWCSGAAATGNWGEEGSGRSCRGRGRGRERSSGRNNGGRGWGGNDVTDLGLVANSNAADATSGWGSNRHGGNNRGSDDPGGNWGSAPAATSGGYSAGTGSIGNWGAVGSDSSRGGRGRNNSEWGQIGNDSSDPVLDGNNNTGGTTSGWGSESDRYGINGKGSNDHDGDWSSRSAAAGADGHRGQSGQDSSTGNWGAEGNFSSHWDRGRGRGRGRNNTGWGHAGKDSTDSESSGSGNAIGATGSWSCGINQGRGSNHRSSNDADLASGPDGSGDTWTGAGSGRVRGWSGRSGGGRGWRGGNNGGRRGQGRARDNSGRGSTDGWDTGGGQGGKDKWDSNGDGDRGSGFDDVINGVSINNSGWAGSGGRDGHPSWGDANAGGHGGSSRGWVGNDSGVGNTGGWGSGSCRGGNSNDGGGDWVSNSSGAGNTGGCGSGSTQGANSDGGSYQARSFAGGHDNAADASGGGWAGAANSGSGGNNNGGSSKGGSSDGGAGSGWN